MLINQHHNKPKRITVSAYKKLRGIPLSIATEVGITALAFCKGNGVAFERECSSDGKWVKTISSHPNGYGL